MSKRTRGSARTQHRRPGTRPASSRPSSGRLREPMAPRTTELEAAPIIAEEIIEERPTAAAVQAERVARSTGPRHRIKAGSLLAARAATEYLYVAQDLRRIVVVGGGLFAALILIWVLIVVMRVVPLAFY